MKKKNIMVRALLKKMFNGKEFITGKSYYNYIPYEIIRNFSDIKIIKGEKAHGKNNEQTI